MLNGSLTAHSTMRSFEGVGSIATSRGRAMLAAETIACPGARFGRRFQSPSSTPPTVRLRRLMTLALAILCRT